MPEALKAFEKLKMRCMMAPMLVFPDFEKPFHLETDTSKEGLGAVLLQESDNGQYHLVAFASRELRGGEVSFVETRVLGRNRAVLRISPVPTLHHTHG